MCNKYNWNERINSRRIKYFLAVSKSREGRENHEIFLSVAICFKGWVSYQIEKKVEQIVMSPNLNKHFYFK